MQPDSIYNSSPLDLAQAAREFATEVGGTAERKKKTISSPNGLQAFLLYVRASGHVPSHQVAGPITVQTILGESRISAEGREHRLPAGTMICLGAGVTHDVSADSESVMLVTHAAKS